MRQGRKCPECGYVPAPIDRGKACVRCQLGMAHVGASATPWRRLASGDFEALVEHICARGDGWLRIKPDSDGTVHWKYRLTSGRWAGYYIYWRQERQDTAGAGVAGLASRLLEFDSGQLKPSKDVYR